MINARLKGQLHRGGHIMEYKFSEKVQTLKPSAIRELFKLMVGDGIVALSGGNPAKEAFPEKEIAEITQKILTENPIAALQYSDRKSVV